MLMILPHLTVQQETEYFSMKEKKFWPVAKMAGCILAQWYRLVLFQCGK